MPLDLDLDDVRGLPDIGQPRERHIACGSCGRPTLARLATCARCVAKADLEEQASSLRQHLGLVVTL